MKVYNNQNVYEASIDRIKYMFDEFDNVLVAFSGGKDSGVLLNLCYDYAKKHNKLHKLSMYHLDYEAQYDYTTNFVTDCFLNNFQGIKKFWLCLPIAAQCAVSMHQDHWTPWDKDVVDIWARKMPENKYVINEDNVPFEFKKDTLDYDLQDKFGKWFSSKYGSTAVAIGIRSNESMNRYRTVNSRNNRMKKFKYDNKHWINIYKDNYLTFKAYPIYDWTTEDIWIANVKFGFKYNKLYDLYYQAGLSIEQMRVASPFNDCAVNSLKIYKVIEPNTWAKLVGRVNGVNFAGIYGGTTAMGWKSIKLPKGHAWKSYMEFLLETLPEEVKNNYLKKLETSKKFWKNTGGALDEKTIEELKIEGVELIETGKLSNRSKTKQVIKFNEYLDDTNVTEFKLIPTYKRMCICIMKNDHLCKYMGFSPTKEETKKRQDSIAKYKNIIRGK